jgi:hypothetical protein
VSQDPPGLLEGDVNALRAELPRGRGFLRISRYDRLGGAVTVVYDVLDENENRLMDKQNCTWEYQTEYPPRLAEQPVGTLYRLG